MKFITYTLLTVSDVFSVHLNTNRNMGKLFSLIMQIFDGKQEITVQHEALKVPESNKSSA